MKKQQQKLVNKIDGSTGRNEPECLVLKLTVQWYSIKYSLQNTLYAMTTRNFPTPPDDLQANVTLRHVLV